MKTISKILIVVIITLCILIGLKKSQNFNSFFYDNVYETNLPFIKINNWYEKLFGFSLPFKDLNNTDLVFNEKLSYNSYEQYYDGVKLCVNQNYMVPSIGTGLVLFIGEKENYGNTVIVSLNTGVDVWYSNIDESVKLYDYVKTGELIGVSKNEYIYMVFKKDCNILNYEEYIH